MSIENVHAQLIIIPTLFHLLGEDAKFEIKGHVRNEEEYARNVRVDEQEKPLWSEVEASVEHVKFLEAIKRLREERNHLLDKSDRYVLPDYPHDSDEIRQAWLNYRQQLRDLPANSPEAKIDLETGELIGVTWPTPPS